jgi:hypothetical protein
MMWATFLQVLGILAVIGIVAVLLLRPASMLVAVLAVGVVVAAIVVSWQDIEQSRYQRAVAETAQQATAASTAAAAAAVTAAHTGS